jgi:uncharacterized protein with HEPN domain
MEQSGGLEPEEFLANEVLKRAIVRSLEVIGRLSRDCLQNSENDIETSIGGLSQGHVTN